MTLQNVLKLQLFEYFCPWDQPDVMNLRDKTIRMLVYGYAA